MTIAKEEPAQPPRSIGLTTAAPASAKARARARASVPHVRRTALQVR